MSQRADGPLISVVIPSYNKGDLLLECLRSVFSNPEIERSQVIVVDDHSTDPDTLTAYGEAQDLYSLTLMTSEERGPGGARNAGLRAADAPYVLYLDSDDMISENFLSGALEFISTQGPHVGYVYPDIITFGQGTGLIKTPEFSLTRLKRYSYIPVACLYRRDCLLRVGGFASGFWALEDWDLFLRLARAGFAGKKIPSEKEVFLFYRLIPEQGVNARAFAPLKRIRARTSVLKNHGVGGFSLWFWNFAAVVYGVLRGWFAKREERAFRALPIALRSKLSRWISTQENLSRADEKHQGTGS